MFKAGLVWRMAWRRLLAERKQTALTLLGGSVGVMLAVAAVVFFGAFDASGERWLRMHFGVIDWELTPQDERGGSFAPEQVRTLQKLLSDPQMVYPAPPYAVYPAVTAPASVLSADGKRAAANMLVVGIAPDSPLLPPSLPGALAASDRAVLSRVVADELGVSTGDSVTVTDDGGTALRVKIAAVAEEEGVAGYRGVRKSAGTVLLPLPAAAAFAGLPESHVNTLFVTDGPDITLNVDPFPVYFPDVPYTVREVKAQAVAEVGRMKYTYGIAFMVASGFAVVAGLMLMRELFLMLGDERRAYAGVLRALGFRRSHIRHLFMTEAVLLGAGSALIGACAGSALGYGILLWFRAQFLDDLQRFAALEIPLLPHLSLLQVLLAAGGLLLANVLIAWGAAAALARLPIPYAMKGEAGAANPGARDRRAVWLGRFWLPLSACIVAAFVWSVTGGAASVVRHLASQPGTSLPTGLLLVLLIWLLAPYAVLYLLSYGGFRWIQRGASAVCARLGVPALVLQLAMRYPLKHPRRVFSVSSLFATVFLTISLVLSVGSYSAEQMARDAEQAGMAGYPAYVPYADAEEKAQLERLAEQNRTIRPALSAWTTVEPYRLNVAAPGTFGETFAMSIVSAEASYVGAAELPLLSRAPGLASDSDVWERLRSDPDAVVLHKLFSYAASDWPDSFGAHRLLPEQPIQAGDTITFDIYPPHDMFRSPDDDPPPPVQRTVYVAGFADVEHNIEFYHLMLVSPQFYEQYRDNGFQWPNTPALGYMLAQLDVADLEQVRRVEEQFVLAGVHSFRVPSVEGAARAALLSHTFAIYAVFMVVSVVIGLSGLAIVQMRAVRERTRQIGMLRCIGVGRRSIMAMFFLEGTLIGWIGLLTGWAFGTAYSRLIYELIVSSATPLDETSSFAYPYGWMIGLTAAVMLITAALGLLPAYRSVAVQPGAAVRSVD